MFSKPVNCAICEDRIPVSSIRSDMEAHHPRYGDPRPDQQTITCSGCGRLLHTTCVGEAGTTISGHHLWFSNMRMRGCIQDRGLLGLDRYILK